jgi:ATP-binding cassette subfamily C protein CydD
MARPDRRLLTLDRRVGTQLGVLALIALVTALLVVAQARILAEALAVTIRSGVHAGTVVQPVAALALIVTARAVLAGLVTATSGATATRAKSALRQAIAHRVLVAEPAADPVATGAAVSSGEVMALLVRGLDGLDGYFVKYLPQLVAACVVPLVIGLAIMRVDLTSAITIGVTLPLIPVFMVLIGLATRRLQRRRWSSLARLAHHYTDLLAGLPTLKVFGRARAQVRGLEKTNEAYRSETVGTLRLAFCSALVLEIASTLSVALVAVAIGLRLIDGHLDLQTAFFVLLLAPEVYLPVRAVGVHYHDSADGLAAAERAFEVLDAPTRTSNTGGIRPARPSDRPSRISFQHVDVTYPGRSVAALRGLTLELAPGETVALTGPSGSGKSTVLAVLLGLVTPTSGAVRVGDDDLADLDLDSWRSRIAWLPQRPTLLAGTIGQNVALGTPAADAAAVRDALVSAGAAELDPARGVGERGEGLSVGEQRRVGLARALVRFRVGGAWLALVDEPTAGLDPATEDAVIRTALAGLHADAGGDTGATPVTVLMVTHRIATMAVADRVIDLAHVLEPAAR